MPDLDPTVRRALDRLAVELPAMYDRLTPEQRANARVLYARMQGGVCPFCLQRLDDDPPPVIRRLPLDPGRWPPRFFEHPVHLHHDHRTGLTIGAYHARCNAVLAAYLHE